MKKAVSPTRENLEGGSAIKNKVNAIDVSLLFEIGVARVESGAEATE